VAPVARIAFHGEARKALINHRRRAGKAPLDTSRKAPCLAREGTFTAIHVQGIADENQIGLPFPEQGPHFTPGGLALPCPQDCEGLARAERRVANGNADLAQTEVESEEAYRGIRDEWGLAQA